MRRSLVQVRLFSMPHQQTQPKTEQGHNPCHHYTPISFSQRKPHCPGHRDMVSHCFPSAIDGSWSANWKPNSTFFRNAQASLKPTRRSMTSSTSQWFTINYRVGMLLIPWQSASSLVMLDSWQDSKPAGSISCWSRKEIQNGPKISSKQLSFLPLFTKEQQFKDCEAVINPFVPGRQLKLTNTNSSCFSRTAPLAVFFLANYRLNQLSYCKEWYHSHSKESCWRDSDDSWWLMYLLC